VRGKGVFIGGGLVLIRRLLTGDWNEDSLILLPGQRIEMTYDHDVIAGSA